MSEDNQFVNLDNDELSVRTDALLGRLYHVQRHAYYDDILLLRELKERFDKLTTVDESLLKGLKEIISYPGVLAEQDVKTLKDLLVHITQPDKS